MLQRPSFFEMAAADRLVQGLKPALDHILRTAARHMPRVVPLAHWSDEIFYGMCFLLDRHYLKEHSATFAENFYCLKRVRMGPGGRKMGLRPRDRLRATLLLAGVPYIRRKLERYYTELQELEAENAGGIEADGPALARFRRAYLRAYPYLAMAFEGLEYLYALRYIVGSGADFSPLTSLLSQRVERITFQDIMRKRRAQAAIPRGAAAGAMERAWSSRARRGGQRAGLLARLWRLLSSAGGFAADNAKWFVYIGVFLIRFLQWWYSPENQERQNRPEPSPPPPPPSKPHALGVKVPKEQTRCPLCLRRRVNAAMLPSGYVFCYTCIFSHLTKHRVCPVTLRPCRTQDMRKIYEG